MCNAWNHSPGCACGWGGIGHKGRSSGGWSNQLYRLWSPGTTRTWKYPSNDFCSPTTCPRCGARVFFVRHNGGSVWFDSLGPPWPKHACFDDDYLGQSLRYALVKDVSADSKTTFGIVTEVVIGSDPEMWVRVVVECSGGTRINQKITVPVSWDLTELAGSLVIITKVDHDHITLLKI